MSITRRMRQICAPYRSAKVINSGQTRNAGPYPLLPAGLCGIFIDLAHHLPRYFAPASHAELKEP